MQIHDQILGFWVPVADFALVAVGVPRHLLGVVSILLVLGQQLVVLLRDGLCGLRFEGLAENHRFTSRFRDGRWSRDGAVPGHACVVLQGSQRIGRVKLPGGGDHAIGVT